MNKGKLEVVKQEIGISEWNGLEWANLIQMNITSMNQGKLEVVKQEMARVNINILGISELKWTGMGECNSDDNYIYYCARIP